MLLQYRLRVFRADCANQHWARKVNGGWEFHKNGVDAELETDTPPAQPSSIQTRTMLNSSRLFLYSQCNQI